jgi:hypothetical protein
MFSTIDKIVLNEQITHEELNLLNQAQLTVAHRLIYNHIPLDKYFVEIDICDVDLGDFADSLVFKEYVLYNRSIRNCSNETRREFIENYPTNMWFTNDVRETQLFAQCNVIKSLKSIYIKELYDLQTISQFPAAWKQLCKWNKKESKIKSLEVLTQYETDAVNYMNFIYAYEGFAYKYSNGKRHDVKVLTYIMRQIIAMCDYSDRMQQFKTILQLKYYAVINDHESALHMQLEYFNKVKAVCSFNDILLCLIHTKKYKEAEQFLLENLETCYYLSKSRYNVHIIPYIINIITNCNNIKNHLELIFNNQLRKYMTFHQKRTVYYAAFIINHECLICCTNTDYTIVCLQCNKATCCMKCTYSINMKKCMLCNYSLA